MYYHENKSSDLKIGANGAGGYTIPRSVSYTLENSWCPVVKYNYVDSNLNLWFDTVLSPVNMLCISECVDVQIQCSGAIHLVFTVISLQLLHLD